MPRQSKKKKPVRKARIARNGIKLTDEQEEIAQEIINHYRNNLGATVQKAYLIDVSGTYRICLDGHLKGTPWWMGHSLSRRPWFLK